MNPVLSTHARRNSWQDVADFIVEQIDKLWINADSAVPYRAFITKQTLNDVWLNDQHLYEEPFVTLHRYSSVDFENFVDTSIQLVSALVYYGWNPFESECRLQTQGLAVPRNDKLLSDDDLPLTSAQIKDIFGNAKESFKGGQYAFKPAIIKSGVEGQQYCRLPEGTRLPFYYYNNEATRNGWYGDVAKVKVAEGHLEGGNEYENKVCRNFRALPKH